MRAPIAALLLGLALPTLPLAAAAQTAPDEAAEAVPTLDPATLVGLPVLDSTGHEVGTVENVVLRAPGDELVVVRAESLFAPDRLIGLNVNRMDVAEDGDSVQLRRLKRPFLADLDTFSYAPDMRTVVPRG